MLSFPLLGRARSWAAHSTLVLLSFLVLSVPCFAQYPGGGYPGGGSPGGGSGGSTTPHYDLHITGGTITGDPNGFFAPGDSNNYYGSASTSSSGAGKTCSVTAKGPLTAKFDWNNGGDATVLPPPSVIISQTCTASWGSNPTSSGTGSGTADNGLSTGVLTTSANGAISTSTLYTGKDTPGASFSVTCTPTATFGGTNGSAYDAFITGQVNVTYSALTYPLTISLSGTTKDSSGTLNILVGQGCTASLVGIPSDLLNNTAHPPTYSWTVSGTRFQAWSPSPPPNFISPVNPNDSFYSDGPGPLTNPTAHWYWNEAVATETVKCTATVTPPPGLGASFPVTATQQVSVANPTYACTHSEGVASIRDGGLALKAVPADSSGHGETWYCNVLTPALFGSGGSCNFSQIITPGRSHTYSTGAVPCTENGKVGLDTVSPYSAESGDPYTVGTGANAGWPADNSQHRDGDSPGTGLVDSKLGVCASVSVDESFNTFLMYLPPGSDVQPVPIHEVDWKWAAATSEPAGGWASANNTAIGPVSSTASARTYTHPQWVRVESPAIGSGW